MALPGGGGQQNNIVVNIKANLANFVTSIQGGLNTAMGNIKSWSTSAQAAIQNTFNPQQTVAPMNTALLNMGQTLGINQQQFEALRGSVLNYKDAVQQATAGISPSITQANAQLLSQLAQAEGSYDKAAQAAISWGEMTVDEANAALLSLKQLPLTIDQIDASLKNAGTNIQLTAQGLPMIGQGGQQAAAGLKTGEASANAFGGALEFLTNRIKTVVASLLIVNVVFEAVRSLQDLMKQSQEEAQVAYELSVAVDRANLSFNASKTSLATWQQQINETAAQLRVFSNQDVTQAYTQALKLTDGLNLTTKQMQSLVEVSAAFAETSGQKLADVLDQVGRAVAGGRLQSLTEYGIVIHQNEIAAEALREGLGKNVQALTDQELATVRLNLVLEKAGNLTQSLGNYQGTLAGQIEAANAKAENAKEQLATQIGELQLLIKNMYADFVTWIADAAAKFQPLIDLINYAKSLNQTRNLNPTIGEPPTTEKFGITEKSPQTTYGSLVATLNEDIRTGNMQKLLDDISKFAPLLNATQDQFNKLVSAAISYSQALDMVNIKQNEFATKFPGKALDDIVASKPTDQLTPDQANAIDKATKQIEAAKDARQKAEDKAFREYSDAYEKSFQKERDDRDKAYDAKTKALKKADENYADTLRKDERSYNQDLANIIYDENEKLSHIQEEHQKKLIDLKDRYYRDLQKLDNQYYFNLFDAVANNDAEAIIKAQQKYAIDKAALDNKYTDDNKVADENYRDQRERIEQNTADQKRLLDQRHANQLEDAQEAYIKEKKQAEENFRDKMDEITAQFKEERDNLKASLDEKRQIANDNYQQVVDDIKTNLWDPAFQQNATGMAQSIEQWTAYWQSLVNLEDQFNKQLAGSGVTPSPTPGGGGITCPPGQIWDPTKFTCIQISGISSPISAPSTTTSPTTAVSPTEFKITIGSDGTVSEALVQSVVREVANVIQTIVVQKGG